MATELAPANSASFDAGSDRAAPSDALDNPENLNFRESDEEDQTNNEGEGAGTDTDRETADAQAGEEAGSETAEAAGEENAEDGAEGDTRSSKEPADSVVVAMPNGEKLELKELKAGYLRDRDYRHKTTDLANRRRGLEEMSARVTNTVNAISELLMQQVPQAPEVALSLSDPVRYMQEKAAHDAGMARMSALIEKANGVKAVANTLTQEQQTENVRAEIAKLGEAFPQIKTQEGQKKFFEGAIGAGKELGFSDADMQAVTDHRHFTVLHYAALGLQAEKAKKVAQRKVANVPPVQTPRRQTPPSAAKVRANQDAMKRLAKSGSIHDAMSVDFD
jgi:hypothetical protein